MSNPSSSVGFVVYEKAVKMGMNNGMTIEHELLKKKVLKILRTPIWNADLSWETVGKRFIERIEKL
jgi:hypothetical protein